MNDVVAVVTDHKFSSRPTAKTHMLYCSDVNKARTLKAKAKAKAMAIPMQRLTTMKYEVMKSCFFEYSYKDTSTV